jgi:hypothetical protein
MARIYVIGRDGRRKRPLKHPKENGECPEGTRPRAGCEYRIPKGDPNGTIVKRRTACAVIHGVPRHQRASMTRSEASKAAWGAPGSEKRADRVAKMLASREANTATKTGAAGKQDISSVAYNTLASQARAAARLKPKSTKRRR